MRKQVVYLAGGFATDWGDEVIQDCEGLGLVFVNPKKKEYKGKTPTGMPVSEYGPWDLHFIKSSDIVFVYVDSQNPSCIGLSAEAGYAKGLGKTVILVLEPGNAYIKDRYLQFLTCITDAVFEDLHSGVEYLKSFSL